MSKCIDNFVFWKYRFKMHIPGGREVSCLDRVQCYIYSKSWKQDMLPNMTTANFDPLYFSELSICTDSMVAKTVLKRILCTVGRCKTKLGFCSMRVLLVRLCPNQNLIWSMTSRRLIIKYGSLSSLIYRKLKPCRNWWYWWWIWWWQTKSSSHFKIQWMSWYK